MQKFHNYFSLSFQANRRSWRKSVAVFLICILFLGTVSAESLSLFALEQTKTDNGAIEPIEGRIESIGVFKNGLAYIVERFDIPHNGTFSYSAPPTALYGTFFVQCEQPVQTRLVEKETEVPISNVENIDWSKDFQGRKLRVILPGESEARTVKIVPTGASTDNAKEETDNVYRSTLSMYSATKTPVPSTGVLLECENGESIWLTNPSALQSIVLLDGSPKNVLRKRTELIFDVKSGKEENDEGTSEVSKQSTLRLYYLTTGICWTPQYRVEFDGENTVQFEQSAILINDRQDFTNVSVSLLSGFPQLLNTNWLSPMSPNVSLVSLLSNIGRQYGHNSNNGLTSQLVMNSAMAFNNMENNRSDIFSTIENSSLLSDNFDFISRDVGIKSLKKGERLLFTLDGASTDSEHFVYWNIQNARDSSGRELPTSERLSVQNYGMTTSGYAETLSRFTEPWDVLSLKNPLDFPLTTGPCCIFDKGQFIGQNTLYWTNPQESTIVPITKALSLRANSRENERIFEVEIGQEQNIRLNNYLAVQPDLWGKIARISGYVYRVAVVDADIDLHNQRSQEIKVKLNRQFSGVLIDESVKGFDNAPEITRVINFDGDNAGHNPQCELTTTLELKPNERRSLHFSYQILIAQ